ncbi:MAG TPA: MarR family transcriptional regulator [Hyphomicrobiaceae bacterium]|jgi:DNA-binding MarR family transcriptional regulator|nr:MarR family transcriptional regulator [Hyphomicrobiaceae bacterium]
MPDSRRKPQIAATPRGRPARARQLASEASGRGYRLENQIGHLLRRAHQRHVSIFLSIFSETGLTPTQFAALFRLYEDGPLSQNELGRLTAMDPATIKGVVARLERRGLVERRPDPGDQRRISVSLTVAGRGMIPNLLAKAEQATKVTLTPLNSAEAANLLALLRRLC